MYLERINGPEDVKKLNVTQLKVLANEVRQTLLEKLSRHGGHFGPNLGMVEAIIALHAVFDSPKDKIVFDVSHQSYTHKMLTGRKDAFLFPEHYDDVTGYTNPRESIHDCFTVGHTSTSVSLACGLAKARDLNGEKNNVIAVIGDGSLSGGEALEGLNVAAELKSNLIIIVNDNEMSIAENHGGLYQNLQLLRQTNGSAECNLFRAMGLEYLFVAGGNDIPALYEAFIQVKDTCRPTVVHIHTQKGKGYAPAEANREGWHYSGPFTLETGKPRYQLKTEEDYSTITADFLLKKMKEDPSVVAITAGTPTVMGFTKEKRQEAGSQFIDVGIAEQTAVALSSGIAAGGGKPVFGVYSSFIQRTFDQLSQDLCIDKNPATLIIFEGSVYGMNDVTHLGLQDIPMMGNIPNLVYLAPTNREEYLSMLSWSLEQTEHPVAIRVPGGHMRSSGSVFSWNAENINHWTTVQSGSGAAIIGLGTFYPLALDAAKELKETDRIQPTVIKPYSITDLDIPLLSSLKKDHHVIVTLEDGFLDGGFGEKIARFYGSTDIKVLNFGIKKGFLDRYDVPTVLRENRLTAPQIVQSIRELLK